MNVVLYIYRRNLGYEAYVKLGKQQQSQCVMVSLKTLIIRSMMNCPNPSNEAYGYWALCLNVWTRENGPVYVSTLQEWLSNNTYNRYYNISLFCESQTCINIAIWRMRLQIYKGNHWSFGASNCCSDAETKIFCDDIYKIHAYQNTYGSEVSGYSGFDWISIFMFNMTDIHTTGSNFHILLKAER